MLYFLDLLGTLAFVITGGYKARIAKLNIFGVVLLGATTAFGGGTFRDLVIGRTPLFYLKDYNYLLIAILGGVLVYYIPIFFKKTSSLFRLADSVGLAAFVVIGTSVCFNFLFAADTNPSINSFLVSVILGMITGFGGGVFRDALMGDLSFSFNQKSNYIASSFLGALSFYFLMFINVEFAIIASMTMVLVLREVISPYGFYKKVIRKTDNK